MPLAPTDNDPGNQCFNEDANNLVKRISADLVYIDPPYNSRQYCDTYHLLENVARWGKARGLRRGPEDGPQSPEEPLLHQGRRIRL